MARLTEEEKARFLHHNFAHRGLHTEDKKIPENSIAAFRAAAEAGYGVELDVQLSSDGEVVVFHDDTLDRVTGVKGRVDAYPLSELQQMSLCGTEETIPLFTEVLAAYNGAGPMVVELKTGPRNNELCEKTLRILREYKGVYCIESFDPTIVNWFRKNAPDIVRGQLATCKEDYLPAQSPFVAGLLSNCFFSVVNKPDFIAYKQGLWPRCLPRLRKKGIMIIAWTPHDPAGEKDYDAMIFEFYRPKTVY